MAPFEQVEDIFTRQHRGTGLGLPLADSLIRLHGGTLVIDSERGQGTTVTIALPRERMALERAA